MMSSVGPGHYDSQSKIGGKDSMKFTMGQRREKQKSNQSPGPGNYDPNESQLRYASPSYKISTSGRKEMISSD